MAAQSAADTVESALYHLGVDKIATGDTTGKSYVTLNNRVDHVKQALLRWHPWNFAIKRFLLEPTWTAITGAASDGSSDNEIRITSAAHGRSNGERVTIRDVAGTAESSGTWVIKDKETNTFDLKDSTFTNTYVSGGEWTLAGTFDWTYAITLPADCLRVLQNFESFPSYKVEGRKLLTDDETNNLRYIYDVTDYTTMDPQFYMCLGLFLAYDVADRIAGLQSGKKEQLHKMLFGAPGVKGILPTSRFVDATEDTIEQLKANDWLASRNGMTNLLASVGRL